MGDHVSGRVRGKVCGQFHSGTQSTCSGGVTNSGERDRNVPVGLVLSSSLGKLHGLSRKLSDGSDWVEVDRVGLAMVGALGRL
jgi:hypothetical protein